MRLLERMRDEGDFEQVVALHDRASGLSGFMVLHDTTRGPAAGGIRILSYPSEEAALSDAFLLAKAMTFKAAAADLPVGGGKIVLMETSSLVREEALRAVGRALEILGGRFLAGRDVGVPVEHGAWVREVTRFMVDESEAGVGDLNRATAIGVESGAAAALRFATGRESWQGVRVAIQGAGGVGAWLAEILARQGAELFVSDTNPRALESLRERAVFQEVAPDRIFDLPCDLLAPCATGGLLDSGRAGALQARAVAGSANNLLASPEAGEILFSRGIAYGPDYLVNAGALIQGIRFLWNGERSSEEALRAIGDRTLSLLERSRAARIPPEALLLEETRARLRSDRRSEHWFLPRRSTDSP
jgi:glutamate dehydrogenase/leucine dehydrogenase